MGSEPLRVEYVEACLICGIQKGKEQFDRCNPEMANARIAMVEIPGYDPKHLWGEMKIVHGWYGKSVVQMIEEASRGK